MIRYEPEAWNKSAFDFAKTLTKQMIEIDKSLRNVRDLSPAPDWIANPSFLIPHLVKNQKKLNDTVKYLEEEKAKLEKIVEQAKMPFRLLYETGLALEEAVKECLAVLGFYCNSYRDDQSEFDAIFSSPEGNFLGEITGSEKAIDTKKVAQLIRNKGEYASQTGGFVKCVLFGNGNRLKELDKRAEQFTKKCFMDAEREKIALIKTSDLFFVYRYLLETEDKNFAKKCRDAILEQSGIISFPPVVVLDFNKTSDGFDATLNMNKNVSTSTESSILQ